MQTYDIFMLTSHPKTDENIWPQLRL